LEIALLLIEQGWMPHFEGVKRVRGRFFSINGCFDIATTLKAGATMILGHDMGRSNPQRSRGAIVTKYARLSKYGVAAMAAKEFL